MKYIDEYRDKALVLSLSEKIKQAAHGPHTFMEVCGGHTTALYKFGIKELLPPSLKLLSGPGCPVCVTDISFIDKAVAFSRREDVIIATFGDLLRVPGSSSSLAKEKAQGADIRMVYSPLEALGIAKEYPQKKVVFLGIGFETTAPTSAAMLLSAQGQGISNIYLYSAHKIMPPAMGALIDEGIRINGYLCPGHVSTITGSAMYEPLVREYGVSCVISGFEPTDMLQSVLMLVKQREEGSPKVEIQYKRAVKQEGNPKAQAILEQVFTPKDDIWRGLGLIGGSGLQLKDEYTAWDAEKAIDVEVEKPQYPAGCICGLILKGLKTPLDCSLFNNQCHPANPVGACMVSSEGACAAYYLYHRS